MSSAQPQSDHSYVGARLRGLDAAVIGLDLEDQKDHFFVSRDSLAKLQSVLLLVKSLGAPLVMGGDFNVHPAG